jgi:DHA2 family multidrug resistance protein
MTTATIELLVKKPWAFYLFLISVCLLTFMDTLDLFIILVSLPTITSELGQSPFNGVWIITSYAIGNTITLSIVARLASKIGEIKLLMVCLIGFIAFSCLCGLSSNFINLVMFRFFQGCFSGPFLPITQMVHQNYSPVDKKALSLGAWGVMAVSGIFLGPIIGGYITENFSWHWLFFINLPVGIIAGFIIFFLAYGTDKLKQNKPLDWFGFAFLALAVVSLQIGFDRGNDLQWFDSKEITFFFIVAAISFLSFIIWSATSANPIFKITLFKNKDFAISIFFFFISFTLVNATMIIYTIWLQVEMHYTSLLAGYALVPVLLPFILGFPIILKIVNAKNVRYIAYFGYLIFIMGLIQASLFNNQVSFTNLITPRILMGVGGVCLTTATMLVAVSSIRDSDNNDASIILSFSRIFSISIGSSLGVAYLQYKKKEAYDFLRVHVNHLNEAFPNIVKTLESVGYNYEGTMGSIKEQVTSQALTIGLNEVYMGLALVMVILFPLFIFLKIPKKIKVIAGE